MSDKYESLKDKLFKLKALAERGVGGEADNARRLLLKLCADNGIMKRDDGTFVFKVKLKPRTYEIAHVGDTLVEMEDGTWLIDP